MTTVVPPSTGNGTPPIFFLNLLLGWTVLGWIVAMIWSEVKDSTVVISAQANNSAPVPDVPMVPVRCSKCGHDVGSGTKFCGNCGESIALSNQVPPMPIPRFEKWVSLAVLFLIILIIVAARYGTFSPYLGDMSPSPKELSGSSISNPMAPLPAGARHEPEIQPASVVSTPVADETPHWQYDESADEMKTGMERTATVKSVNTLRFDFPHGGEQRARLVVRSHPRYGKDVIVAIQKGQLICFESSLSYGRCHVISKFDDGKPIKLLAVKPADSGTTTMLFLEPYKKVLGLIKKSKKMYVSAIVYGNGEPTFEFDVPGLKWD